MRIDLSTPVTLENASTLARDFAHWWLSQMQDLVPLRWRDRLARLFDRRTVVLEGPNWQLTARRPGAVSLALDTNAPDAVLRDLIQRVDPDSLAQRVNAQLPASEAMIRTIRLPAAAASHLQSVVRLQLDRLSPFPASDVQFDCVAQASSSGAEMEVDVAIVPKSTLHAYETRLANMGLAVARFEIRGTPFRVPPSQRQWTGAEKIQIGLAIAAAIAWLCVFFLPPTLRDAEYDSASTEVSALSPAAHEAADMRNAWDRLKGPADMAAARLEQPDPLAIMTSLTDILPDDVELLSLTIDGSAIHLEGFAHDTRRVLAVLKKSRRFVPRLAGPVTHAAENFERFDIDLTLLQPPGVHA